MKFPRLNLWRMPILDQDNNQDNVGECGFSSIPPPPKKQRGSMEAF